MGSGYGTGATTGNGATVSDNGTGGIVDTGAGIGSFSIGSGPTIRGVPNAGVGSTANGAWVAAG